MSGIKAPIQDVLAKLATLQVTTRDNITVPLHARVWNNHIKDEESGKLYNFQKPAAFVEILNPVAYTDISGGYHEADLGWKIHLVHEYYNDHQDLTMEQDLEIFDLRDQIVSLLNGFEPTACSPMVRTEEFQDYDHTNLYHYTIVFACSFIDSKGSGWDQGKYIDKAAPTDLEVDLSINDLLSEIINYPVSSNNKSQELEYTAAADGETQAFFPGAIGGDPVMAILEVSPLKKVQYSWDSINGFLTLQGGITMDAGQTLFFIFSKPIA